VDRRERDRLVARRHADRIQARAIRRCGELLKQFDGRGGDQSESKGDLTSAPSQKEAAQDAGMSLHQQRTAVRVANVPADQFERDSRLCSPELQSQANH
jgi:hypothetical protein